MTATQPETITLESLATPFGPILVAVDAEDRLCAVEFWNDEAEMRQLLRRHYGAARAAFGKVAAPIRQAFEHYFAGDAEALKDVPWTTGGTEFQRKVWQALTTIPGRRDLELRPARRGDRQAEGRARRRPRQRRQPGPDRDPLPPRDRRQRLANRLRRRPGAQALAAAPRRRGVRRRAGGAGDQGRGAAVRTTASGLGPVPESLHSLPSPLRGGVGGGGVSAPLAISASDRSATTGIQLAPPPLTPPRRGEGNL